MLCIVTQENIGEADAKTPDILVAHYNLVYVSDFSLKLFILTLDTMAEWSKAVDLSLTSSVVWPLLQKCAWVRNPLVSITLFARSSRFLLLQKSLHVAQRWNCFSWKKRSYDVGV
jgi:hypothetical protein